VPYRLDLPDPPADALDTLIAFGALDVEAMPDGLAALLPDTVSADAVAEALGGIHVRVSPAVGRDNDSVWTLSLPPVRIRSLTIVPADDESSANALRLVDGAAFGTGLHPTTALCLEIIEDLLDEVVPDRVLDVGTGSGVLALAALRRGVPRAIALELDPDSLRIAAHNSRLNGVADRLLLVRGGPESLQGSSPLVVANIRAAELMEMAQTLVRSVARNGRLVLSGIPESVVSDVDRVYRRLGMKQADLKVRAGWAALMLYPSW
jgi:ribosomal protein L11 methyltransferase